MNIFQLHNIKEKANGYTSEYWEAYEQLDEKDRLKAIIYEADSYGYELQKKFDKLTNNVKDVVLDIYYDEIDKYKDDPYNTIKSFPLDSISEDIEGLLNLNPAQVEYYFSNNGQLDDEDKKELVQHLTSYIKEHVLNRHTALVTTKQDGDIIVDTEDYLRLKVYQKRKNLTEHPILNRQSLHETLKFIKEQEFLDKTLKTFADGFINDKKLPENERKVNTHLYYLLKTENTIDTNTMNKVINIINEKDIDIALKSRDNINRIYKNYLTVDKRKETIKNNINKDIQKISFAKSPEEINGTYLIQNLVQSENILKALQAKDTEIVKAYSLIESMNYKNGYEHTFFDDDYEYSFENYLTDITMSHSDQYIKLWEDNSLTINKTYIDDIKRCDQSINTHTYLFLLEAMKDWKYNKDINYIQNSIKDITIKDTNEAFLKVNFSYNDKKYNFRLGTDVLPNYAEKPEYLRDRVKKEPEQVVSEMKKELAVLEYLHKTGIDKQLGHEYNPFQNKSNGKHL